MQEILDSPTGGISEELAVCSAEQLRPAGGHSEVLVQARLVEEFQQSPKHVSASSEGFKCSALIHKAAKPWYFFYGLAGIRG